MYKLYQTVNTNVRIFEVIFFHCKLHGDKHQFPNQHWTTQDGHGFSGIPRKYCRGVFEVVLNDLHCWRAQGNKKEMI